MHSLFVPAASQAAEGHDGDRGQGEATQGRLQEAAGCRVSRGLWLLAAGQAPWVPFFAT